MIAPEINSGVEVVIGESKFAVRVTGADDYGEVAGKKGRCGGGDIEV